MFSMEPAAHAHVLNIDPHDKEAEMFQVKYKLIFFFAGDSLQKIVFVKTKSTMFC